MIPKLKQIKNLLIKDFEEFNVWVKTYSIDAEEPWWSETDEETVRPWVGAFPVDKYAQTWWWPEFLVASSFEFRDGSLFHGIISPVVDVKEVTIETISCVDPRIFLGDKNIYGFWWGMLRMFEDRDDRFYKYLQKRPESVFPVKCKSRNGVLPPIALSEIEIPGFCYFEEKCNEKKTIVIKNWRQ